MDQLALLRFAACLRPILGLGGAAGNDVRGGVRAVVDGLPAVHRKDAVLPEMSQGG